MSATLTLVTTDVAGVSGVGVDGTSRRFTFIH